MKFTSKKILKKLRKLSKERQELNELERQALNYYRIKEKNDMIFISIYLLLLLFFLITAKDTNLFLIEYIFLNIVFWILNGEENKEENKEKFIFAGRIHALNRFRKKRRISFSYKNKNLMEKR